MKDWLWKLCCLVFLGISVNVKAQTDCRQYRKEVQGKIDAFENNLISWVKLDSSKNWNIYERMKDMRINGLSIAVIRNYKIEWSRSYGWADTVEKRRVTDSTLFQSASIGKSINGFAFMKLAQDKKLDLDSDINRYRRTWKYNYDSTVSKKSISLANILSHSAGLTVHGFEGYKSDQTLPSLNQILDGSFPANNAKVRSEFKPGIKFQYSGGGYEISERILEDLTHQSYDSFISENIFKPLKMSSSTYTLKPDPKRTATAYRYDGQSIGCKYHLYPEKACGAGLWTTATDLAKFVIEIQLSLKRNSKTILRKQIAELMLKPYLDSSNAALGFFIDRKADDLYFQHSGLNEGFSSQYYGSVVGGNGVVVLVNSDNTSFKDELVNSIATVYNWPQFYGSVKKKIIILDSSITNKYLGQYKFRNEDAGPIVIREQDQLYIINPGSTEKWRMYFTSASEFFMLEARWANQQFYFDEDGRVSGFYILGKDHKEPVTRQTGVINQ